MSDRIILVENINDWKPHYPGTHVVVAKEYLAQPEDSAFKGARVINLCRSYRYLSLGYYSSLLAEARRHKVIPSVRTITDLGSKATYSLNVEDLDGLIQKSLKTIPAPAPDDTFEVTIIFGQCLYKELQELARQIFDMFRCPLLKVEFEHEAKWQISSIKPSHIHTLNAEEEALFVSALNTYLNKRWQPPRPKSIARYDLAILYDPTEKLPPSAPRSLQKFIKVGKTLDLNVELIQKKDYSTLAEYDALFIRETTKIQHHTYRFAKKAEAEGMVVIDDPDSILKCTNKVYLAELLAMNKIPRPKTVLVQKGNIKTVEEAIPYPVVLKIPDGSFSRGVHKVSNSQELIEISNQLFKESDIILAQEFIYTEFDWRIGILNRTPFFACQYFMSKRHWQIVKYEPSGQFTEGGSKALPLSEVPSEVIKVAVNAANLIGDGLYGVDLKQNERGVYVIEVNDNPNIDIGSEDAFLGDELYKIILEEFIRRLDARRGK